MWPFSSAERRSRREMELLAARKAAEYEAELAESRRRWDADRELLETVDNRPFMEEPDFGELTNPFGGGRKLVCLRRLRANSDTGEVVEDKRTYYADSTALESVSLRIAWLESQLDDPGLGISSARWARSNVGLIRPCARPFGESPFNFASLEIIPPTPSGKRPKYYASISFHAYAAGYEMNGSHGEMRLLPSGAIGRADLNYWRNHEHLHVEWRTIGGTVAVSAIDYKPRNADCSVRVYTAQKKD